MKQPFYNVKSTSFSSGSRTHSVFSSLNLINQTFPVFAPGMIMPNSGIITALYIEVPDIGSILHDYGIFVNNTISGIINLSGTVVTGSWIGSILFNRTDFVGLFSKGSNTLTPRWAVELSTYDNELFYFSKDQSNLGSHNRFFPLPCSNANPGTGGRDRRTYWTQGGWVKNFTFVNMPAGGSNFLPVTANHEIRFVDNGSNVVGSGVIPSGENLFQGAGSFYLGAGSTYYLRTFTPGSKALSNIHTSFVFVPDNGSVYEAFSYGACFGLGSTYFAFNQAQGNNTFSVGSQSCFLLNGSMYGIGYLLTNGSSSSGVDILFYKNSSMIWSGLIPIGGYQGSFYFPSPIKFNTGDVGAFEVLQYGTENFTISISALLSTIPSSGAPPVVEEHPQLIWNSIP